MKYSTESHSHKMRNDKAYRDEFKTMQSRRADKGCVPCSDEIKPSFCDNATTGRTRFFSHKGNVRSTQDVYFRVMGQNRKTME